MFGIEFKFASTDIEKNTHVIRIQQSGAILVPPGGTSKLHSQNAHRQKGGNGQGSSEMRFVLLFHWEERSEEHISAQGKFLIL